MLRTSPLVLLSVSRQSNSLYPNPSTRRCHHMPVHASDNTYQVLHGDGGNLKAFLSTSKTMTNQRAFLAVHHIHSGYPLRAPQPWDGTDWDHQAFGHQDSCFRARVPFLGTS